MNAGQYISGAGHLGLIAYVLFGGLFLHPEEPADVSVQEVALISESEFAAMVAQSTAPDTYEIAPEMRAPETESAPEVSQPEESKPEQSAPETPPPTAPEPKPEPPQTVTPPVEVQPTPPSPQADPEISLEDPGAGLPDRPDRKPTPRPVPRIADRNVTAPEPQPEISDTPVEAANEESESPEVVEEKVEESAPQETATEIVTEAEKPSGMSTSPRPKSRPANLAAQVQAAQQAQETPKPATPAAEPKEDTSDAVADAAAAAAAALAAESVGSPAAPERPVGPPLTAGEREGMRVAVSQCWNVGAMSTDAMRTVITVGVAMNEDGTPQAGSIKLLSHTGGTEAGAQSAFEVARRAIIRCGARGFPLPVEKYAHWRNIEMTFDPEQMRFK
ncbi:energy transducer TonB [Celeribacter persicus]|uniref:Cell division and transport-associated protein TolA n=1 Tax=Celeribacter persicus TaxID=1651082 RepID=A0A2T5HW56_9RHOB|nr:energy transducer TonB [Celeribacter persicus]PTQ75791.1 cell division and transport-associated protein TolA [Celeribacter persicus]